MNVAKAYPVNINSLMLNTADMPSTPAAWAIPGRYKVQKSPNAQISSTCYICVNRFSMWLWQVLVHHCTSQTQFRPLWCTHAFKTDPDRTVTCHINTPKPLKSTRYYYRLQHVVQNSYMILPLNHKYMPDSQTASLECLHLLSISSKWENRNSTLLLSSVFKKISTAFILQSHMFPVMLLSPKHWGSRSAGVCFTCALMNYGIYMAKPSAKQHI